MFNVLKAPKSDYSDSLEKSKFELTWNIFVFLTIIFSFLSVYHLFTKDDNIITSLFAMALSFFSLLLMYKKRTYLLPAIITIIFGFLICQHAMFIVDDSERVSDLLWMMLISFYSFFILSTTWGVLVLSLSIMGLLIKLLFFTEISYSVDPYKDINTVINVTLSSIVISYILHKLITSTKISNNELKDLNKKLEDQNNEKAVLLKEIHHRVKNNLQVVSSLLRLQANELTDENTITQFNEAVSRISSMALIHEKMYQKEDLANLDLKIYLDSLIQELMSSYSTSKNISANVHSELKQMEVKNLVPVALIFNELITNSLKHAFSDTEKGEIDIKITTNQQDVIISYRDSGTWVDSDNEYSFGMTLIDTFTEQLDGKYTVNHENGTEYQFYFSTPRKSN